MKVELNKYHFLVGEEEWVIQGATLKRAIVDLVYIMSEQFAYEYPIFDVNPREIEYNVQTIEYDPEFVDFDKCFDCKHRENGNICFYCNSEFDKYRKEK